MVDIACFDRQYDLHYLDNGPPYQLMLVSTYKLSCSMEVKDV